MILKNVQSLNGDLIHIVLPKYAASADVELNMKGSIAFPALINSHDHLDFNLFNNYGDHKYNNYKEWGRYIHEEYKEPIKKVLSIPALLRIKWGLYKNLLCGVTTVINHGKPLPEATDILNVYERIQNLHSTGCENNWRFKINNPARRNEACVIHIGEGTDDFSFKEINEVIKWNFLNRDIIGVHAIAMNSDQSKRFKATVWCPVSNYFMFNTTASVQLFQSPVLFGTDSTLTSVWDIWEHLRFARNLQLLSPEKLYKAVTSTAAEVWKLPASLSHQSIATDIVIAKSNENEGLTAFYSTTPAAIQMVIHKGELRLYDDELHQQLKPFIEGKFTKVAVHGKVKWVYGNLPDLMKEIKTYYKEVSFPIEAA